MKKSIIWIVVIVVIIIVIIGLSGNKAGNQNTVVNEPIKIGFIAPLTGDAAVYGVTEKNSTILALEKLKAEDSFFKDKQIDVIYEDGKCTGKDAASAAQKLINVDKVKFIFGGMCSAETLGAAPAAEQAKVLLFSAYSSAPAISNSGDYIFRNSPSDNDGAKIDVDLLSKKGYKNVAIISEITDFSAGIRTLLKELLPKKGVNIIADETYSSGAKDFRTSLLKIKALKPDAVYLDPGTSPGDEGLLIKQAREVGITAPLYTNFFLSNAEAIKTAGKSAEGVVFSNASELSAASKPLIDEYKKVYGSDPAAEYELGSTYDRVFIIMNAIKAVGYDATKVKDYLYKMAPYNGSIGTYSFTKDGDIVGVGYSHYVIKDGKIAPYTE